MHAAVVHSPGHAPCYEQVDDPATVAAVINPGVSGWLALHRRAGLAPGEKVLVLGATGAAGSLAVQLAQRADADVVAAGRNPDALAALAARGARTVPLDDDAGPALAAAAADADVVVDYVWGSWTGQAMAAIADARPDPARPLRWVQVGTTAGPDLTLPGALLRRCAIQLVGSGPGALSPATLQAGAAELLDALPGMDPVVTPAVAALRDVERAWDEPEPAGRRLVLAP